MDYNELSKITDSNRQGKNKQQKVQVPPGLEDKSTKTSILDTFIGSMNDKHLKTFKGLRNVDKKRFISRLTDSSRRQLLKKLSLIKDNVLIPEMELVTALTNYILVPTDYNKDFITDFNSDEIDPILKSLVRVVLGEEVENKEEVIEEAREYCKLKGLELPPFELISDSKIDEFVKVEEEEETPDYLDVASEEELIKLSERLNLLNEENREELTADVRSLRNQIRESINNQPEIQEEPTEEKVEEEEIPEDFNDEPVEMIEKQEDSLPIEVPLSHSEFHQLMHDKIKNRVWHITKALKDSECKNAQSVEPQGEYIKVLCEDGTIQYWIPICGSEEFMDKLKDGDINQTITEFCVRVKDAKHVAYTLNELSFINPSLYKKKLSDSVWTINDSAAEYREITAHKTKDFEEKILDGRKFYIK